MQDLITTTEPTMRRPSGYIYVIQSKKGLTKVGCSRNSPESRIQCHRATLAIADDEVAFTWVSERHQRYRQSERNLICALGEYSHAGREWFSDVVFDEVVDLAKALIDYRDIPVSPREIKATQKSDLLLDSLFEGKILTTEKEIAGRADMASAFAIADMLIAHMNILAFWGEGDHGVKRNQLAIYISGLDVGQRADLMCECHELVDNDDVQGWFELFDTAEAYTMELLKKELPEHYERIQELKSRTA
jgi:hypothetical protein